MDEEKKPPKTIIIPAPIWLLSFGDTIALMLAFFVMLFAMSSIGDTNVSKLITAITSDNPENKLTRPVPNSNLSMENIKIYNGMSLDYVYELLEDKINKVESLNEITLTRQKNSVVIGLPNGIFVSPTQPEITEMGRKMLFDIGLILAPFGNVIQVEGHNLPQQISNKQPFSNHWEMRLLRSTAVAQQIRSAGLLSSTKVLGWSFKNTDDANSVQAGDNQRNADQIDLRITKIAGGQ